MGSIPKFLASIITLIIGLLLCVSFIISGIVVNSARTYHSSVIEEIEASDFDEITIQKCIEAAAKDNYSLTIERVSGTITDPQCIYKVVLSYGLNAPIYGKIHKGTLVGYAFSGMHKIEPSIEIPENPETGDVFIYGDYEYRYNMYYYVNFWKEKEDQNGWGARVLDPNKTSYQRPLSMIGATPVTSLRSTYEDCTNLIKAPTIPHTITRMDRAYNGCVNLSDDDINIPNSVTSLSSTFVGCTSEEFVHAPVIPDSVTDMTHAFSDCINLKTAPKIPASVTTIGATFYGCTALTEFPDLSSAASLTVMSSAFRECTSLPSDMSGFVIPSTVSSGYQMFQDCTQLVTAPVIPATLDYISSIFEGCTSLTGEVTINCNPPYGDSYDYGEGVFKDTVKPIILSGSCSEETKNRLIATATNGNVSKQ